MADNMLPDGHQSSPRPKLEFWIFLGFLMFSAIWSLVGLILFRKKLNFAWHYISRIMEKIPQKFNEKNCFKLISYLYESPTKMLISGSFLNVFLLKVQIFPIRIFQFEKLLISRQLWMPRIKYNVCRFLLVRIVRTFDG